MANPKNEWHLTLSLGGIKNTNMLLITHFYTPLMVRKNDSIQLTESQYQPISPPPSLSLTNILYHRNSLPNFAFSQNILFITIL